MDTSQDMYSRLEHWQPVREILPAEEFVSKTDELFPLFNFAYEKTEQIYKEIGTRKNGEPAFIHPINVVTNLKRANTKDPITLSIGLLHDFVEEEVDLFKRKQKIAEDDEGVRVLDNFEKDVLSRLFFDLENFCNSHGIDKKFVSEIVDTVAVLTRHKRHFYYSSMAIIFNYPTHLTKIRAIQVKLADRMHNIKCIECYTEEERIYQCFKNLFILNNTKEFLLEYLDQSKPFHLQKSITETLFTKCCKATYDAFLVILHLCRKQGIAPVCSMLQLAFKKFAFELEGMWEVTFLDTKEIHPMRLFQGVIRKWDKRLLHEWDKFDQAKKEELDYCRNFFSCFNFNEKQLRAIIDYKDAYSIKEGIARLLYLKGYALQGFQVKTLSQRGSLKDE